jgi:2-keto-4-pentenoate hydratase/2-oxohepta-3-ene-1,7-dioic acid hydratase in catechol pathway
MRFASFEIGGRASYGVALANGVHDLGARLGSVAPDLKRYLAATALGFSAPLPKAMAADYASGEFRYLPVVPNPGKILCVGLNYQDHRKETGRPEAPQPAIFVRFADSLVAHQASIWLPEVSTSLDYEGELAVVIGKPAFRVPEGLALGHVAGYACFNDATIRDWQHHTHQFTPGKNFPKTGALGPELVTPDAVRDFAGSAIETRLNGQVMQSAKLGDMIFSVARIVSYVSGFTPLKPGDVIATGTPGGVGAKRQPPLFMKVGDAVEVTIAGVGHLSNTIAAEGIADVRA